MKFKKWIVENKYGISQMKIWSKETPIENEENPATCGWVGKAAKYGFFKPFLDRNVSDALQSLFGQ